MVLLRNKGLHYRVGFALFFLALVVFVCSLAVPGTWLYERDRRDPSLLHKRSVWYLSFPTCLGGHGFNNASEAASSSSSSTSSSSASSSWRCEYFGDSYALGEKKLAVTLMMTAALMQLGACVLITVQNRHGFFMPCVCTFEAEILAGLAVTLAYTGVLIYIRFTYFAVNLKFGPGVILHFLACGLSVPGLLLTSLYQPAAISSMSSTSTSSR